MNSTRRILIVDDEPEIRTLIAQILVQGRLEIRETGSAAEAVRILEAFKPSLLITDFSLPDANGSELIEKAKRMLPEIRCLIITGWGEVPNHLSRSSRADVIMSKPFSVEALETETRRLLSTAPKEPDTVSSVAQGTR